MERRGGVGSHQGSFKLSRRLRLHQAERDVRCGCSRLQPLDPLASKIRHILTELTGRKLPYFRHLGRSLRLVLYALHDEKGRIAPAVIRPVLYLTAQLQAIIRDKADLLAQLP